MKLTIHDGLFPQVGTGSLKYKSSDYPIPFKFEATVSTGYTELTLVTDWDLYWSYTGDDYHTYRNHLIDTFIGSWGSLTNDEQKTLVRNFVYPSGTPVEELDALYPESQRDDFMFGTIKNLDGCNCNIIRSNVSNSKKHFSTRPDDDGILITTEIITDGVL